MIKNTRTIFLLAFTVALLSSCAAKKPFSFVVLPDTQNYSWKYPEIFTAQTQWIADNANSFAFVIHVGDITHNNNDEEWQRASSSLFLMDGKIPYVFVAGNHDLGVGGKSNTRDSQALNKYLPYEKYSKMPGFGGAFEAGSMDNTWHTFEAGGANWLILCLEFGPRDKVLEWANQVIADHPKHTVIINTHAYTFTDNTRMSLERGHKWVPQNYKIGKLTGEESVNDGEMMWEKLASRHKNVLMVVSGHVLNSGVGRLESQGAHGNTVYQMLANYQMGPNGGDGFLRIITVDKKKGEIAVRSFSPHTKGCKTDPDHEFTLKNVRF